MSGGMLHRIEFIRPGGGKYYPGDVAAFDLETCRYYVDKGIATWVDDEPNGHGDDDGDDGAAVVPAAGLSTHEKSVSEVRGLVAEVETPEGLRALRDSEVAHPRYDGGRKTALEAIDDRLAELEDADGD